MTKYAQCIPKILFNHHVITRAKSERVYMRVSVVRSLEVE